ncbi:hypothetical protein R1sor_017774 [Riccia sorocarpa]|uniref:Protein kinase domain-containing protein n=1 Tax=Riccia sorocarpa TaxID=122646 RepID=A0ABD3I7X2_9MARC
MLLLKLRISVSLFSSVQMRYSLMLWGALTMLLRRFYGSITDLSAGVILYILLSGVPPFWAETEQGVFEQVLREDIDFMSDSWPSISESAKDLLRKMLHPNAAKRLKAHQDGRIDYNEFVTMMREGNGGIGRHTMRNSLKAMSLGDVSRRAVNGGRK